MNRSARSAKVPPASCSLHGSEVTLTPGGQHRRQHVAAVVGDEDALPAGAAVSACCQLARPCWRLNSESVVPCPNSTGMSSRRPWSTCHFGPFFAKNVDHVLGAGDRPVRPGAGGGALDERLVDGGRQRVGGSGGGAQRERPLGADDALGRQALVQVEPGDLGGERVEDRLALGAQRLERRQELVAAAVAAADRTQPRVARPVLLDPGQARDQRDQAPYVVALVGRVLDVGLSAALAEAALVERQHAVPRVQPLLERRRVGGPRAAPAVAVHDHRHPVLARRRRPGGRASSRSATGAVVSGSGTLARQPLVTVAVSAAAWAGGGERPDSRVATTAPTTARRAARCGSSCRINRAAPDLVTRATSIRLVGAWNTFFEGDNLEVLATLDDGQRRPGLHRPAVQHRQRLRLPRRLPARRRVRQPRHPARGLGRR